MVDELEERRRRADAAWQLVVADVVRLREAVSTEVNRVKDLGRESVNQLSAAHVFERYPLAFAGAAAGLGFLFGVKTGRRKSRLDAIASGVPQDVLQEAAGKSFSRKLFEAAALALLQRGAQNLAQRFVEAQMNKPDPAPAPRFDAGYAS